MHCQTISCYGMGYDSPYHSSWWSGNSSQGSQYAAQNQSLSPMRKDLKWTATGTLLSLICFCRNQQICFDCCYHSSPPSNGYQISLCALQCLATIISLGSNKGKRIHPCLTQHSQQSGGRETIYCKQGGWRKYQFLELSPLWHHGWM